MLVHVLAIALCPCLSVCLSVTSRCSIEMDKRVIWFLIWGFFRPLCFKEIQVSTKIRALTGTFLNSELKKISPRHIDRGTCYQLSSRKVSFQNPNSIIIFGDDDPIPNPTPPLPSENLPGFSSISRVVLVRAGGGSGPMDPPPSYAPDTARLRKTVYTHCASVHQPAKLVAALLRVAR